NRFAANVISVDRAKRTGRYLAVVWTRRTHTVAPTGAGIPGLAQRLVLPAVQVKASAAAGGAAVLRLHTEDTRNRNLPVTIVVSPTGVVYHDLELATATVGFDTGTGEVITSEVITGDDVTGTGPTDAGTGTTGEAVDELVAEVVYQVRSGDARGVRIDLS